VAPGRGAENEKKAGFAAHVRTIARCSKSITVTPAQGCQMLPNLAIIAKNHRFPKELPTILAIFVYAKILPFFEIPLVSIDKTIHFGLFIK